MWSIYRAIIPNIQKSLEKGSGCIIDSVFNHTINISKHNPSAGSSYIKLPKELDHPKKSLINIRNTDVNECFKCWFFRYLHPADHHPARIRKVDKYFAKELDFKDIKFPVKIKIFLRLKKIIASTLVFLVIKTSKNTQSLYQEILSKDILIYYS